MAFGFYFAISTGLKLEFLTYKELSKSEKRMFIIRGLIYMYVVQIVVTLILDAFNLFELSNNQEAINALAAVGPLTQIFLVIFAVFLAPFTEEILFRRTLFNFIKKNSTPFLAVLLSSILFGLIHGLTELSNPVVLLPYVAVGIVLQYFYIQSKTLMVPMIMHALFNLIGVVVILVTTYFPAILS
jgi:membrane protease YdiL (CAAX protease family)